MKIETKEHLESAAIALCFWLLFLAAVVLV